MTQCSLSHPARKWGASLTSFTFTFNNWTKSSTQWLYHQNHCLLSSVYFYLLLLEAFKVASNLIWFSRFHLSPCWYISILGTRVVPLPYTSNLILSSCMKQSHCSALDCEIYSNMFYIEQIQQIQQTLSLLGVIYWLPTLSRIYIFPIWLLV